MTITLIGTGNVATSLYPALTRAGHEVEQLRGREFTLGQIVGDVVIISVRDETLPAVAEKLAMCEQLVVHTAGSVPVDTVMARRRGVLYPMQTFSRERIVDFSKVPLFVESPTDMSLLLELAQSISRQVFPLDGEGRKRLHLAAVFACNFANHCYDMAAELLAESGLPFDVLLPLVDETAHKVHALSPRMAQTGPAVRDDRHVMNRQEQMLTGRYRDIYRLMSQSIQEHHDKLRLKKD